MSVEVVISDADTHAGLFHSVIAQGNAAHHPFLAECPVVIVHEHQAGCRIARHEDVRPAVFVEVGGDYSHPIAFCLTRDSSLFCDVGERAIPVIAIKGMATRGKTAWS